MQSTLKKIAIVGAATLLGKELNEVLAASPLAAAEFILMDDEDLLGKLESAGDAVTFVQRIAPESFHGCDIVFFAAQPEVTRKHWQAARRASACVVDLTGALESDPGVRVLAPWVAAERTADAQTLLPDLQTVAAVPAHPAAMLLALLAARLQANAPVRSLWATLLLSASEHGNAAILELHQQTVNLLSFQPLPQEVFGAQAAFNLAVSFGEDGKTQPARTADTIERHYASLACGKLPELALQVAQAPVFHGSILSLAVELDTALAPEALQRALAGEHVEVLTELTEAPGNVGITGNETLTVLVRPAASSRPGTRYWLWIAVDNLRLAALNAVACAVEMSRLRPQGTVQ
jgi:aspartate-semialdehyde dehydrogenase